MYRASMLIGLFWIALLLGGCAGDDADRLIPPGDTDHAWLEAPERANECQTTSDCAVSCVHSCVAETSGPQTCPAEPTPPPPRVEGAPCTCQDGLCVYQ